MHQTIARVDGTAFAVIRQLMCTMMTWWCPEECLKHGAAVVGMAISEEGRCITSKDKVAALQKSYRLLRQNLDFPPKDIILDCHLQSLRLDAHPAASGVPARMPHASVVAHHLPSACHSERRQRGPGRRRQPPTVHKEARQRCEDAVILNSGKVFAVLKRFMEATPPCACSRCSVFGLW
ncbi:metH [Symbiodinium sp. CCMP2592]|nr:metH [Symbiodinium sp. CCMP2592]